MQDKLTSWFLGLPAIVILLVLLLGATLFFGVKYLNKREAFWMAQVKAFREQNNDMVNKLFGMFEDALKREVTVIQKLNEFEKQINEWFRR